MKILLLRTWLTNIGNGFIEKGARSCLESAFPSSEVIEISGYLNKVADEIDIGFGVRNALRWLFGSSPKESKPENIHRFFDLSDLLEFDVAVLPGCVLYQHALRKYIFTLEKLKSRNIPIIFLGAGGGDYKAETQDYIKLIFKKLGAFALLTRDSDAFHFYSSIASYSYDGLDCGFFISDWYSPPKSEKPFVVSNFDKRKEPKIPSDKTVIRTNHAPFSHPFRGVLRKRLDYDSFFSSENLFLSDSIRDYLFLYANSSATYSDRVHACVATLAYGNSARIYTKSPRAALLQKVVDSSIHHELTKIEKQNLVQQKKNQCEALKISVEELL